MVQQTWCTPIVMADVETALFLHFLRLVYKSKYPEDLSDLVLLTLFCKKIGGSNLCNSLIEKFRETFNQATSYPSKLPALIWEDEPLRDIFLKRTGLTISVLKGFINHPKALPVLFSRDDLLISELDLFKFVTDLTASHEEKLTLVKQIRFENMRMQDFLTHVNSSTLLTNEEKTKYLMLIQNQSSKKHEEYRPCRHSLLSVEPSDNPKKCTMQIRFSFPEQPEDYYFNSQKFSMFGINFTIHYIIKKENDKLTTCKRYLRREGDLSKLLKLIWSGKQNLTFDFLKSQCFSNSFAGTIGDRNISYDIFSFTLVD